MECDLIPVRSFCIYNYIKQNAAIFVFTFTEKANVGNTAENSPVKVPGSWAASCHETHDLQRAAVAVDVSCGLGRQLSGMRARHTHLEVIWITQPERRASTWKHVRSSCSSPAWSWQPPKAPSESSRSALSDGAVSESRQRRRWRSRRRWITLAKLFGTAKSPNSQIAKCPNDLRWANMRL